jgi:capsular polysaccharide biosynthesis protein
MESQSFSEDIRRYLALAWHWAWLLILAGAIAAGVAYYINRNTTPVYQASATFLINEAPLSRSADYTSIVISQSLAQTYALLITKEPVLQGVVDRLGLNIPARNLAGSISVTPIQDTQLLVASVVDTNPQRAVDIANTLGEVFAEQNQTQQASRYTASKQNLEEQLSRLDQQIQEVSASLNNLGEEPTAGSATPDRHRAERDRLQTTLAQYRQTYA